MSMSGSSTGDAAAPLACFTAVGAKAEVWLDRHASRSKKSNGERLDSGHKKHPDRIP